VTAPTRARPLLAALLALSALIALPACGQPGERTLAETEGIYVDVGRLQYQVQISRQLNPRDTEDKAYFVGVPTPESLAPTETWFAVFIKVWNRTGDRLLSTGRFEVEDTTGKRYEPVEVGEDNVFVYRPADIPANGTLPPTDSVANEGAIGGSMLLFKITLDSLANRPLELRILSPQGNAVVDLDV
jgi:hypothetical protein